jgi:UDP-N-acetylglucosamine--N-acetylmuramyl-(pentapeptide) pyrophosphoryl-undecaprenol N-acetylglucosamine transferase
MKAILTGGGTGGHIFPLVSVARALKEECKGGIEFLYVGPEDGFSDDAFKGEGIEVKKIKAGKLRRYTGALLQNLSDIFINIPSGLIQSLSILSEQRPDFIFSKGGYGSLPVVVIGRLKGIPVFLHESDSIPGLANKIIGVFAKKIFISFPQGEKDYFPREKISLVGNPVRRTILEPSSDSVFILEGKKPVLLVLGGSQGSVRVNDAILQNLNNLLEKFEIMHQTGRVDYERVRTHREASESKDRYHILGFVDERQMSWMLHRCDGVISRSGSSSISEIAATGKPSVLIPLPESAQGHQSANAKAYAEVTGASIVLEEDDLTPVKLSESIDKMLTMDKSKVIDGTRKFSRIEASNLIAREILEDIKK